MESAEALNMVHQDLALAQHLGLRSIPSVIAPGLPSCCRPCPWASCVNGCAPGGLSHYLTFITRAARRTASGNTHELLFPRPSGACPPCCS
jgi:hypothetical protein